MGFVFVVYILVYDLGSAMSSQLPFLHHQKFLRMSDFRRISLSTTIASDVEAAKKMNSPASSWKESWRCGHWSWCGGKAGPLTSKHYINPAIWLPFSFITLHFPFTKNVFGTNDVVCFWEDSKNIQNEQEIVRWVECLCACQKYELYIRHAFHRCPNCIQDYHAADRREDFTPLFSKKFVRNRGWACRLYRFCYKTSASSSSSELSETLKSQKPVEKVWMCWKLLNSYIS